MTQAVDPPNSKDNEMMVLGCMLTSIHSLKIASERLSLNDFYYTEHGTIFNSLKSAHTSHRAADIHLIAEELKRQDQLDFVGGAKYLITLAQYAGTSAYIEDYVSLVKEKSILRKMLETGRNLEKVALSEPSNIRAHLDSFQKELDGIKKNKIRPESLYQHLLCTTSEKEVTEEIKRVSPGARVGITLGKVELKIPGGALTILAGPTGHGKTLVKINMLLNYLFLNQDKKAYFFSYEESRATILSLFMNVYINTDLSANNRESIRSYLHDEQPIYITSAKRDHFIQKKDEFFKTLVESGRLNIFYCDYAADELVEAIRYLKSHLDIGLVAIDYMQLLRQMSKKTTQRQEELKEICLMLKDCAVDTGLPLLLSAQFNRTVVNEATISPVAIGEAGDIERAANTIIGMWNRNYEGFTQDGNKSKDGKKIHKESAIYLEILKSREVGISHSAALNLNGNTGKLSARNSYVNESKDSKGKQEKFDLNRHFGHRGS